jgi:hypothetical protein
MVLGRRSDRGRGRSSAHPRGALGCERQASPMARLPRPLLLSRVNASTRAGCASVPAWDEMRVSRPILSSLSLCAKRSTLLRSCASASWPPTPARFPLAVHGGAGVRRKATSTRSAGVTRCHALSRVPRIVPDTGVAITRFLVGGIGSTRWTPLQNGTFSHGCPLKSPERDAKRSRVSP